MNIKSCVKRSILPHDHMVVGVEHDAPEGAEVVPPAGASRWVRAGTRHAEESREACAPRPPIPITLRERSVIEVDCIDLCLHG